MFSRGSKSLWLVSVLSCACAPPSSVPVCSVSNDADFRQFEGKSRSGCDIEVIGGDVTSLAGLQGLDFVPALLLTDTTGLSDLSVLEQIERIDVLALRRPPAGLDEVRAKDVGRLVVEGAAAASLAVRLERVQSILVTSGSPDVASTSTLTVRVGSGEGLEELVVDRLSLTDLDGLSTLRPSVSVAITNNPDLPQATVDAFVATLRSAGFTGTASTCGNAGGAACDP